MDMYTLQRDGTVRTLGQEYSHDVCPAVVPKLFVDLPERAFLYQHRVNTHCGDNARAMSEGDISYLNHFTISE